MTKKISLKIPKRFEWEFPEVRRRNITMTADVRIAGEVHEVRVWSEEDNWDNEFDSGWEFENEKSVAWFKKLPEELQEAFEDWMSDEGIREMLENVE
jgi:hypothetical protein